MKRRAFIQSCAAGALSLVRIKPPFSFAAEERTLEEAFRHPPGSARPKTWWHWMNGNVSAEGITHDLEAMHRVGIAGFQIFQIGAGIPKGPVDYNSPGHLKLLKHAVAEAGRLGMEFGMMNCPGWSSSGGPWIPPELSMQQLTWSETFVAGGQAVDVMLPQPYTKRGYYRDAFVLAFPSLKGEPRSFKDRLNRVTSSKGPVDVNRLTARDPSRGVEIRPAKPGQPAYLLLEFAEPFGACSVEVYLLPIVVPGDGGGFFLVPNQVLLEVSDDGVRFRRLCDLSTKAGRMRRWPEIEAPATGHFPAVRAKYFRLVISQGGRIAGLRLSGAKYIADWPCKANFAHRTGSGPEATGEGPLRPTGMVPAESVIDPTSVLDITNYMDRQGRLKWRVPSGNWTILRLGQTTTGVCNHPAPDGGLGLECDKFSQAAYDFHFNHFFGKLFPDLDPLAAKGMAGVVIDSYEVGMQNWTAEFPQEFERRRGYDLKRYLPALTGRVVGSGDISDRFLWDFRRTCADLMADNYYGHFAELCHQHGMKAYAEPYGSGPFEEIQAASRLDVPMGEFWVAEGQDYQYTVKLASSVSHLFGKMEVGAESYTSNPQLGKWQNYPYTLKSQGDWMFTKGLTQFLLSNSPMQPHPSAVPGMTNGPFGWMHDRNDTWFKREGVWLKYVGRCQYMLQQGLLVADLVYFAGVDVPVDTPLSPEQLNPAPPEGYYYDVANAEAILTRMRAEDGRITLPDGMTYRVLILPRDNKMTLDLLREIRDMVEQGVCVVGPKPERTPGLTGYPEGDAELRRLADEVWGDLDGTAVTERPFGKGRVFWGQPMTSVLAKLNIRPDFEFTSRSGDAPINYIHRRVGDTEIYFIANRRRQAEELVCSFRVENKKPELWSPESGDITPAEIYDLVDSRVRMPLRLGPAGSTFVVFRSPAASRRLVDIVKDGKTIIGTKPFPLPAVGRYREVTNNFTVSVWIMPDTDMGLGIKSARSLPSMPTSFVIYPPAGTLLYGKGHVTCGLVAGRNGLAIFERTNGDPIVVLAVAMPLVGWTHVGVVYSEGAPLLYVNGKLVRQGETSDNVVHPGLDESYQRDGAYYFYGNMSEPVLFPEVLSEGRIQHLAAAGIPKPESPPTLELETNGKAGLLFWENGRYTLRDSAVQAESIEISGIERPVEIGGPWHVSFPPNLGAPQRIILPKLMSLHMHSDPGVKYFSGTATYSKTFSIPASIVAGGNRLYLDLGWVQVLADVWVNGRDLGRLWKAPYRIDITDTVHLGDNLVEIHVTNLWVNRLVGDEQFPPENEYLAGGREGFGGVSFPGAIMHLPDWYKNGKPKPPGGRITFTTWKHFDRNSPLVESGLLGPVRLRIAVRRFLDT